MAGGGRTASGLPIIAGDPHRILESPGVYQQVQLSCPEFDVVGFAFPGVPGIQHFAHAGDVAWAITNAMADYQDLYVEQLRRGGDGVEARGSDGWYVADSRVEEIEVAGRPGDASRSSSPGRGPVFVGGPDAGEGLSLRTPAYVGRDLGFDAFLPLLRARSVDDVDRALDRWVEPVNNVVIADVSGAVRYRVAGRVPQRDEAARVAPVPAWDERHIWRGWVDDLPRTDVPADGALVTANERRGPESAPIGRVFAPPHRAAPDHRAARRPDRADRLGRGRGPPRHLARSGRVVCARSSTRLDGSAPRPRRCARPSPTGTATWTPTAPAPAPSRRCGVHSYACSPPRTSSRPCAAVAIPGAVRSVARPDRAAGAPARPAARGLGSPWGIDLPALAAAAPRAGRRRRRARDVGSHARLGTGGRTRGRPRAATPTRCCRTSERPRGHRPASLRGPVARYVWDLSDRSQSRWIVPLGAAGDPSDPHHHDQLELWAGGRLVPVVTDPHQLTEDA